MKRALVVPAALLALCLSSEAHADYETWIWIENRVPLVRADEPSFPRIDLRVYAETRLNGRNGGLHQSFLRLGPLFYWTDFLFVGVHGTIYADRLRTGAFAQEARFELEPNFFGRICDFTWNDRNRLELRFRDETETKFRYRNQLRINYAPKGAKWIPFVWDEVLVDLSGLGLNQNRALIGLSRMLSGQTRLDIGFMLRSREETSGWIHDRIAFAALFFDVSPPGR